jgi:hypothetical protein
MDSGATVTIGGKRGMFTDLRPCNVNVTCANGQVMRCSLMGTIVITSNGKTISIENSLFIPECLTLISISQLTRMGFIALFDKVGVELYQGRSALRNNIPSLSSSKRVSRKLYTVPVKLLSKYHSNETAFSTFLGSVSNELNPEVIHQRYGHTHIKYICEADPPTAQTRSAAMLL